MSQRTRNTLALAAMVFAAAALPWNPVVTVYWLLTAFFVASTGPGATIWSGTPRALRALRRRLRRNDTPRTT